MSAAEFTHAERSDTSRALSWQARRLPGQSPKVRRFCVSSGQSGVLKGNQVESGCVDLQPCLQEPAVRLKIGVPLLERLEGVCGPDMRRSLGLRLGSLGLEEVFEVGVLMGQVPSLDVGLDGELGDIEVRPLDRCGVPAKRRFIAAAIARRTGSVSYSIDNAVIGHAAPSP